MILMRQIIYETHPENLYTKSNPMVVANFDTTVSNLNNQNRACKITTFQESQVSR